MAGVDLALGEGVGLDELVQRSVRLRDNQVKRAGGRFTVRTGWSVIRSSAFIEAASFRNLSLQELAAACPVLAQCGEGHARDQQIVHRGDYGVDLNLDREDAGPAGIRKGRGTSVAAGGALDLPVTAALPEAA